MGSKQLKGIIIFNIYKGFEWLKVEVLLIFLGAGCFSICSTKRHYQSANKRTGRLYCGYMLHSMEVSSKWGKLVGLDK